MTNSISLDKVLKLFIASFYASAQDKLSLRGENGKLRIPMILLVVLVSLGLFAALISIVSVLYSFSGALLQMGISNDAPHLMIGFFLLVSWLLSFTFGFLVVVQVFYRSKDLSFLLTLPISNKTLLLSRFAIIWFYELLVHLFIMVPALAALYVIQGVTLSSIVGGVVILIFGSVPVICFSGLLAFLLSKIPRLVGSKFAFETISFLIIITVSLGFQFGFQRFMGEDVTQLSLEMQQSQIFARLAELFSTAKNPLVLFASSMDSVLSALLVVAGTLLLVWGSMSILSHKMIRVIQQGFESTGKEKTRKTRVPKSSDELYRSRSILVSLIRKNLRVGFSEVIYFMQDGIMMIFMPVVLVFSISSEVLRAMIADEFILSYAALIAFGLASLIMSFLAGTLALAITKEGKCFNLSRCMPVDPFTQMKAYAIPYMVIYNLYGILLLVVVAVLFNILGSIPVFLAALVTQSIFFSGLGLAINLIFPTTNWVTPQQAIKRSKNAMIGSLLMMGWGALLFFTIMFAISMQIAQTTIALGFIVVTLVFGTLLWGYVKKKSRQLFVAYEG